MINYYCFVVGAFLTLIFAFLLAWFAWWGSVPFLLFSGWLFRMMHLSAFERVRDSKFEIPGLKEFLGRCQRNENTMEDGIS